MLCLTDGCKFLTHTDIKNNGGTHCCHACKKNKNHGPLCEGKFEDKLTYIQDIKPIKVFQVGAPHTGSTLLVNLIHGYLAPKSPVAYLQIGEANNIDDSLIFKTHELKLEL